jgi:phospholipid/cholesterol/gamma-HCH transport system permease protein
MDGAWERKSGMAALEKISNKAIHLLDSIGQFVYLAFDTILACFKAPFRVGLVLQQMEFIGVGSMFIVILTGSFSGAVFTLQSVYAFSMFNMETMVGATVTLAMTRELAPVLTALMITGRACSAMATELGTMRVTEQVDALKSMAVNPVHYLIAPRFIAAVVMFPVLTMVFNLVSVAGSYLVGVEMWGIDPGNFIQKIRWFVQGHDVISGLIKATVFGAFVSLEACFKGYNAEGGARGVGTATTQAVVIGSVTIMVLDYFLTVLMF